MDVAEQKKTTLTPMAFAVLALVGRLILAWPSTNRTCSSPFVASRLLIGSNRIEQLKEIIRAWGQNPEEILTKDALMRGNITETQEVCQSHQLSLLADQLKQLIKSEVSVQ